MAILSSKRTDSFRLLAAGTAVGVAAYLWQSRGQNITSKEASEAIKKFAEDQPIQVELSEEQMEAIHDQWQTGDPYKPAEITFTVKDRPVAGLKVASYSYRGDTCCV